MGIWDLIRSGSDKVKSKSKSPFVEPVKSAYESTVARIIPDEHRTAQIASFLTKFAKNAAVYCLKEGYKLIPGGEAVGKIVSATAREMKAENDQDAPEKKIKIVAVTARKTKAEDEYDALDDKKASIGEVHVYRTAKEGLMDQPSCQSSIVDKKQNMNAEIKDDMKDVIISAQYNNRMEPLKENSDESVKSSVLQETDGSRTSIRSKL